MEQDIQALGYMIVFITIPIVTFFATFFIGAMFVKWEK